MCEGQNCKNVATFIATQTLATNTYKFFPPPLSSSCSSRRSPQIVINLLLLLGVTRKARHLVLPWLVWFGAFWMGCLVYAFAEFFIRHEGEEEEGEEGEREDGEAKKWFGPSPSTEARAIRQMWLVIIAGEEGRNWHHQIGQVTVGTEIMYTFLFSSLRSNLHVSLGHHPGPLLPHGPVHRRRQSLRRKFVLGWKSQRRRREKGRRRQLTD